MVIIKGNMPKKRPQNVNENASMVVADLTISLIKIRQQVERLRDITGKGTGAKEISIAVMKIEEAEMWLSRSFIGIMVLPG